MDGDGKNQMMICSTDSRLKLAQKTHFYSLQAMRSWKVSNLSMLQFPQGGVVLVRIK